MDSPVEVFHSRVYREFARPMRTNLPENYHPGGGAIINKDRGDSNPKTNGINPLFPGNTFSCSDTVQRLLFHEATTTVTSNFITKTRDGSFLIPGYYFSNSGIYYNMPYLIKSTAQGNIVWNKSYNSIGIYPSSWYTANRIKELRNGDLLMVGQIGIPGTDDRRELAVWRLNKNGGLIWGTSYVNSTWTDPITGACEITGIEEDGSGNIFLAGNQRFYELSRYAFVLKLNSRGIVLWDRSYSGKSPLVYGILLIQNRLLLIGSVGSLLVAPDLNSNLLWGIYINPSNGEILNTRAWYANFGQLSFNNSFAYANTTLNLLENGQISVCGTATSDFLGFTTQQLDTVNHSIVANFTPEFSFVSGIMLGSQHPTNYYNTVVTQHPNGRIAYTRFLGMNIGYNEDIIYGSIQNNQVIKERIFHERNRSSATVSNFLFYEPNEDILIQTYGDKLDNQGGLEMIRVNDSDTSGYCSGKDTSLTFIRPYYMTEAQMQIDSILPNTFQQTRHNFVMDNDGNLTKITACQQVAVCDSLKIFSAADSSCIGSPVNFSLYRNPGCGSRARWSYDSTGLSKISFPNDSSISLIFKGGWRGYIYAEINGSCGKSLKDSIQVTVLSSTGKVNLGPETSICPNNSLLLNAKKGFQNYRWQDGATDSTYLVTKPGKYYVTVSDACGNLSSDTILIKEAPPVSFKMVSSLLKCNADSLTIRAPPGFLNYKWSPDYDILTDTGQVVTLFPAVDTFYRVVAEKSLGCVARDSVQISVKHSPSIYLGNDTSICSGDSLVLDAGPGFNTYTWNDGGSSRSTIAKHSGPYSVIATTAEGCQSKDTFHLIKAYKPFLSLDKFPVLCLGSSRQLDAGKGYKDYLWNDGSTYPTMIVKDTGRYWVSITDEKGCKASDTTIITSFASNPTDFLPSDTSICQYGRLTIQPIHNFQNYLWNDLSTASTLLINQPGWYWLQVTDGNNCMGKDSIHIIQKQCVEGLFVPNAFTPNNDGHNDLFRPIILGNLVKFRFSVYDRWGKKVFDTTKPLPGWD
ncbi:MAG TPA: gliding motility-associated C-terminal domain-containing protein, partial [Puia sp.]|nr:gliding motility-associated C-terminal domain-containing protein [Puia sp.]